MDAAMFERHTEHVDPPLEHSVGTEPNQDSAVSRHSASATPGGHTPGSGARIARATRLRRVRRALHGPRALADEIVGLFTTTLERALRLTRAAQARRHDPQRREAAALPALGAVGVAELDVDRVSPD